MAQGQFACIYCPELCQFDTNHELQVHEDSLHFSTSQLQADKNESIENLCPSNQTDLHTSKSDTLAKIKGKLDRVKPDPDSVMLDECEGAGEDWASLDVIGHREEEEEERLMCLDSFEVPQSPKSLLDGTEEAEDNSTLDPIGQGYLNEVAQAELINTHECVEHPINHRAGQSRSMRAKCCGNLASMAAAQTETETSDLRVFCNVCHNSKWLLTIPLYKAFVYQEGHRCEPLKSQQKYQPLTAKESPNKHVPLKQGKLKWEQGCSTLKDEKTAKAAYRHGSCRRKTSVPRVP